MFISSVSLCSSVIRGFRAAASMTASQLVTSWIRAVLSLIEARDTTQRQMDAELRKKGAKVCTTTPLARHLRAVIAREWTVVHWSQRNYCGSAILSVRIYARIPIARACCYLAGS